MNLSSCIDLNLVIGSGFHSFLHSICHNQIDFANFNLKICYPSPYSRQICNFKEGETVLNRKALKNLNWGRAFLNTIVNKKFCIFNKSVLNVLSNFIPHKTILHDDKDSPWLTLWLILFYRLKIKFSKITERTKPIFNWLIN